MENLIYENIIKFLSTNINENIHCELSIPIENINVLIKIKKRNHGTNIADKMIYNKNINIEDVTYSTKNNSFIINVKIININNVKYINIIKLLQLNKISIEEKIKTEYNKNKEQIHNPNIKLFGHILNEKLKIFTYDYLKNNNLLFFLEKYY